MNTAVFPCLSLFFLLAACSNRDNSPAPPHPTNSTLPATNTPLSPVTNSAVPSGIVEKNYILTAKGNVPIGVLRLRFPADWQDLILKVKELDKLIDAVQFKPSSGDDFAIQVEIIPVGAANAAKLDLRAQLQKASKDDLALSAEASLDIQSFQGEQASGYYFVFTDKRYSVLEQPPAGEFRFVLEGNARMNGVILTFRLVSQHIANQQLALLEMIKTAHFTNSVRGR